MVLTWWMIHGSIVCPQGPQMLPQESEAADSGTVPDVDLVCVCVFKS